MAYASPSRCEDRAFLAAGSTSSLPQIVTPPLGTTFVFPEISFQHFSTLEHWDGNTVAAAEKDVNARLDALQVCHYCQCMPNYGLAGSALPVRLEQSLQLDCKHQPHVMPNSVCPQVLHALLLQSLCTQLPV